MSRWREVSKGEFFEIIGKLDVCPKIIGKWPYSSLYKTKRGQVHGRSENCPPVQKYYLPDAPYDVW